MAELKPEQVTILIDTREQMPWDFSSYGARMEEDALGVGEGDYSVKGLREIIRIERKEVGDFVNSISNGRERFQTEMKRLKRFPYRAVVVEWPSLPGLIDELGRPVSERASGLRSRMSPESAHGTIVHWSRRYCPIVFAGDRNEAREYAWKFLFGAASDWWRSYREIGGE